MKYKVQLQSVTPYLQDRMDDQKLEEWEKNRKNIIERPDVSIEDAKRAEFACYRNAAGQCYIPSEHFRQAFINGGGYMKSKVGIKTKSMKSIFAAMLFILPDEIIVPDFDEIDKRSAVNQKVKARIMKVRPKWSKWNVSFVLEIDEDSITIETIKQLIDTTGKYVGIGSYRPTNNGYCGRFKLVNIEKVV